MSATITWIIEWMECKPTEGQYTDVVISAGWRCNGTQADGSNQYNGSAYGSCAFSQPAEGGQFTPYDQLTQQQVLGWCWNGNIDKDQIEAAVQAQIDAQINPPVVQPPLPWSA